MVTVEGKIRDWLFENGIMEPDLGEVVTLIKAPSPGTSGLRWSDPETAYPLAMHAVLRLMAKRIALEYIDEHCPEAWYRALFVD